MEIIIIISYHFIHIPLCTALTFPVFCQNIVTYWRYIDGCDISIFLDGDIYPEIVHYLSRIDEDYLLVVSDPSP